MLTSWSSISFQPRNAHKHKHTRLAVKDVYLDVKTSVLLINVNTKCVYLDVVALLDKLSVVTSVYLLLNVIVLPMVSSSNLVRNSNVIARNGK